MLSRTAENLYWLARYVERAEYLARTIDATLRVTALPAAYIGKTNEWDSALLTAGVAASFYQTYEEANEHNVVDYLSFSVDNPSSIRNCMHSAPATIANATAPSSPSRVLPGLMRGASFFLPKRQPTA